MNSCRTCIYYDLQGTVRLTVIKAAELRDDNLASDNRRDDSSPSSVPVSYTHLTLPTN